MTTRAYFFIFSIFIAIYWLRRRASIPVNVEKCIPVAVILCAGQGDDAKSDFQRQLNQFKVLLKSVVLQKGTCSEFYVVTNEIEAFENVETEFGNRIKLKRVPFVYPKGTEWMTSMFRECATLRLFLPQILPLSLPSIIYLDTDFILLDGLSPLMTSAGDLDKLQKMGALAPCLFHYGSSANAIPYYGSSGLNAGLMILNLARMREKDWTNRITLLAQMYRKKIKLADQDILNIYFHYFPEELSVLPCNWNFRPFNCRPGSECDKVGDGIKALHGNALSFTATGPEPLFYKIFSHFFSLSLQKVKSDCNYLKQWLEQLTFELIASEESTSRGSSPCVKFGGISPLIIPQLQKLVKKWENCDN